MTRICADEHGKRLNTENTEDAKNEYPPNSRKLPTGQAKNYQYCNLKKTPCSLWLIIYSFSSLLKKISENSC